MMLAVFALILLTMLVSGQPVQLICFNPPPPPDAIAARSDPSMIQSLIEKGIELTEQQLEGLTIEEAADVAPEILNNTAITLLQEALVINPDLQNPADITYVMLLSLLNTTDGVQIYNSMLQDPENFARIFLLLISNFDLDCMDNPRLVFLTLLTTMMSDLLQEPFRDQFVTIFKNVTVIIAKQQNLTEVIVSVLEPLSENLEQAENVEGALGSLISFVSEDVILEALSSALESSGFILEPEIVGGILGVFFGRIQEGFGIDGEEFVSFMSDIFESILEALT